MRLAVTAGQGTSWVEEFTTYAPRCGGCGAGYGEAGPSLDAAVAFVQEHPYCSSCEGPAPDPLPDFAGWAPGRGPRPRGPMWPLTDVQDKRR